MNPKPLIHKVVRCGNIKCGRYICTIDLYKVPDGMKENETIVEAKLICQNCGGRNDAAVRYGSGEKVTL